jgi:hypothetical protein
MRSRCNWRNIYINLSFANRTTRTICFWTSTFPCNTYASNYWQRRYICYAEARFLGHQNDAKQFTMMQQIGVNGPAWKCRCTETYSTCSSICERQIYVDVPSIAPTAHSSLVHGHRSSLYSFIVGHCIKRSNALFMIGIHSSISLWTVARLTLKIRARLW